MTHENMLCLFADGRGVRDGRKTKVDMDGRSEAPLQELMIEFRVAKST
jgi:hypothetical protein